MRILTAFLLSITLGSAAWAQAPATPGGVNVGEASKLRQLVPADQIEQAGTQQYGQMMQEAASKGALAPPNHPQLQRLRAIATRILPYTTRFNSRAQNWKWEVNLVGSKQLNAFCLPGGKIAFYTGLIDGLKLTDDEIAIVMGHEIAHALREHARARIAKSQLTHGAAAIASQLLSGTKYGGLADLGLRGGAELLTLRFSRDDESDADVVGLDLAARAGYDPRAGITLWQKMGAASKGAPPQWLSTHPAGKNRIAEIEQHLPEVMPVYEAARKQR
ncbi:MAG: M48 family metallopeptidase [Betaproteobacteria bacterium]